MSPSLKQRIDQDLKTAQLARDAALVETLRGLKSSILNQEIALKKRDIGLSDSEIQALLAKEVKQRVESAALFTQGGNQTSADKELREKEIILAYLPAQMDESGLIDIVEEIINELGAAGQQDMGRVIGAVRAKVGASADGGLIAKIVKQQLEQK